MRGFKITTDNTCDLPNSFLREHGVASVFLNYLLDGESYTREDSLEKDVFYKKMRAGSMPTTSQAAPLQYEEMMRPILEEGEDIIHISFSSNLSGSYNNACLAAKELEAEYQEAHITVVDSLAASLGEGLLVYYAQQKKERGQSYGEIVSWLEENKLHLCHLFTVDDLFHLHRGGRVSKATAIFGTMANIKPLLHVDNEGRLMSVSKIRGRKKSILWMTERMAEKMKGYEKENTIVFISHGDCYEDACFLRDKIRERIGITHFLIDYVGPTIGAHSGPGTLALFFLGGER